LCDGRTGNGLDLALITLDDSKMASAKKSFDGVASNDCGAGTTKYELTRTASVGSKLTQQDQELWVGQLRCMP
jgi:hypothetical protein